MVKRVFIELIVPTGISMAAADMAKLVRLPGFKIDPNYQPVTSSPPADMVKELTASKQKIMLVRGEVEEGREEEIKALPNVVNVWTDSVIEPTNIDMDCDDEVAKGTISDVAKYLRCDRIWAKGVRGEGIVIGICDTGVDKSQVPRVIDGWSPDPNSPPGTDGNGHGTMCATDALGMCPEAQIYDFGILKNTAADAGVSGVLSDAIAAFQWALEQYRATGKPQILSNSWALYKESTGPDYATNINHPFNRKVTEVVDAGIIVVFCAGNCGSACPDNRCGSDVGPGQSIWGANGHPRVITVGGANILEQVAGYSSQGPSTLDFKKPDFCAPTHFQGYSSCDGGTSAAAPICAGVIGLLKSKDMTLNSDRVKEALQNTAKNMLAPGWDASSGYGMIQAEAAYNYLFVEETLLEHTIWMHGTSSQEEHAETLKSKRRAGFYAVYEGKPSTVNRFHFAIPTPAISNGKRFKLDSVTLVFMTDPDVSVTNISIYDGRSKIDAYNNLSLTGEHYHERFDVRHDIMVRFGVGISIEVNFGESDDSHRVGFISAGGHFIEASVAD